MIGETLILMVISWFVAVAVVLGVWMFARMRHRKLGPLHGVIIRPRPYRRGI
jgi:hypothetical protein